jgi:hypothetical protein
VIRDEAEALAIALSYGFADVAAVVRWADTIISTEQHPHSTVCDVALAASPLGSKLQRSRHRILGLLTSVP